MLLTDFLQKSAKKYPKKTAIKDGKKCLSFQEVEQLSDRVAAYLLSQGHSPGDRVGIHLDRSAEGVIAVFGILKAGAVYVPIDITSPPRRKEYIINDCRIKTLLTDSKKISLLESLLKKGLNLESILILDNGAKIKTGFYKSARLASLDKIGCLNKIKLPKLGKNQLANILYTSGSTGHPKGVAITHASLAESINNEVDYFGINNSDTVSSTTPLHFSMSPFEIFSSVKAGAALSIVPPGIFSFPRSLAAFIENEQLTIWHSVPSLISRLTLYGKLEQKNFSKLRLVHLAGGPVPIRQIHQFIRFFPHINCYNIYGSAETYEIARYKINQLSHSADNVPVGRPWEGVEMFLVDESGSLVEEKEEARGELYVKTPSMMQGYWNDLNRTKEVLIDSPFHHPAEKIKLYKTKDILKVDKQGNYSLIGRADNTIKRGGFRIGLTEIESLLLSHAQIEEAAVVVEKANKQKLIKVILVTTKGGSFSKEEIKEFCRKRLPRYMLPDKIELSRFLPKTSTGKVDRKKLEK
jgi:amino acid adenylation domain-containing protein